MNTRLSIRIGLGCGLFLTAWLATGIRRLDPIRELAVVDGVVPGLFPYRTEGSTTIVPFGLSRLTRYPRDPVELPLPQAEDALIPAPDGTRFGFRGQSCLRVRPEAWKEFHREARGRGLAGVLLDSVRASSEILAAEASRGKAEPSVLRAFEGRLRSELGRRGVSLDRFTLDSLDYLQAQPGDSLPPTDAKVLLVGLDGADWAILDPLIDQGKMPNLARLIQRGARAKLLTISPTLSPVVWSSVATGVEPNRHGILDFLVPDPKGGEGQPVTSTQRRAPTVWEILSAQRIPVGIVGWWATWPATPVEGYLVSDRISYQLFGYRSDLDQPEGKTWPPELYAQIRDRIRAPNQVSWQEVEPYLAGPRRRLEDFDQEEQDLLREFRTLLAAGRTYVDIYLTVRQGRRSRFEAVYLEGTDTIGHLFMSYRAPPLRGVDPKRFDSFRFMVDRYYQTADGYLGEILAARGEDWTIFVLSDHGFASDATRPLTTDSRIGHGAAADWHRRFGMLVLSGAPIRPGARIEEASIYDIAPTVLALFGRPVPVSWPGRVLGGALQPSFLEAHPVRLRQDESTLPAPAAAGERVHQEDPAAEELRQKLRSLGYIAPPPTQLPSMTTENNVGLAKMAEGKYSEAEKIFRSALRSSPEQPSLLVNLGLALRAQGKREEAATQFREALSFPGGARRTAAHQMAQLALEASDTRRAESYLRSVLTDEPGSAEVRNTLGLVLEKRGDPEGADTEYRRAAELDPNAAEPRVNLGNMARRDGRAAEAETWYQRAIRADPYFMGAYNNLALVYQDQGEIQKSIDLYHQALAKAPTNAVVLNNLASLYFGRGDIDEAQKLWLRAADADRSYPSPLNNLAGIEMSRGHLSEAERLLKSALKLNPKYGDAWINRALVKRARGEIAGARDDLERALEDPAARRTALVQLGQLELQSGKAARALRWLEEARRLDPRSVAVLNGLGEALSKVGRNVEAAHAWDESLRVDPSQVEIKRRLDALGGAQ